jgi:RimJ/RimL family protein N-acetyltransferase
VDDVGFFRFIEREWLYICDFDSGKGETVGPWGTTYDLPADNQLYIFGLIADRIVSTLTFVAGHRPRVRHSGEFGMSVRQSYWGLGIGSLMLDTLVDWARATRIVTKIDLRVRTDNERAIKLYKRKGFVIEGTIRRAIRLGGEYFDHYCMGLEL